LIKGTQSNWRGKQETSLRNPKFDERRRPVLCFFLSCLAIQQNPPFCACLPACFALRESACSPPACLALGARQTKRTRPAVVSENAKNPCLLA